MPRSAFRVVVVSLLGIETTHQSRRCSARRQNQIVAASWKLIEAGQALFYLAGVLADCLQGTPDVISYIRMSLGFHLEGQFHERSFERELILVYPFQHI